MHTNDSRSASVGFNGPFTEVTFNILLPKFCCLVVAYVALLTEPFALRWYGEDAVFNGLLTEVTFKILLPDCCSLV